MMKRIIEVRMCENKREKNEKERNRVVYPAGSLPKCWQKSGPEQN